MDGIILSRAAKILDERVPVSLSEPQTLPGVTSDQAWTAAPPPTAWHLAPYVQVLFCRMFAAIRWSTYYEWF
jgi:hypothetical protein